MDNNKLKSDLQKSSLWDFRTVKVYRLTSEKFLDFFLGFFVVPLVFGFIFSLILDIIGSRVVDMTTYLVEVILIFYFYQRRKYLAFGLIVALVLGLVFSFLLADFYSSILGQEFR